jgi:LysW-gamma-L-lysine carboxypeptidase
VVNKMENSDDAKESMDLLKASLKIYSPSGSEKEIAKFYTKFLEKQGFQIHPSEVGNVIGTKGSGKPVLFLSSHIDTIPPELPFKEENKFIYARGAVDCKSSWVSMLYSAGLYDWNGLFKKFNNSGTIILCGVVKEEDSRIGIESFFKTKFKPDLAIFGEPTGFDRICYAYRGRIWIKVGCITDQGHASSSWNYCSSAEVVLEFWNRIKQLGVSYPKPIPNEEESDHFNEITITLTTINAGELGNSTPCKCNADIDIRIPPSIDIKEFSDKIKQVKINVEKDFGVNLDLIFESQIKGVETNTNSPLINALRWAIFKVSGTKGKLLKKTGTTFMNSIEDHYKIPTIVYGPGDPRLEHTQDEKISKEEYFTSIQIYKLFYDKVFELWNKVKIESKVI